MNSCQCFNKLYRGQSQKSCSCFNENIGREYICPKGSITPGSNNMGKLSICQTGGDQPNCGVDSVNYVPTIQPPCNPPGFMESFGLCPEKDQSGPYNYDVSALGYTLMPYPKYLANPYKVPDQNGGAKECAKPGYQMAINSNSQSNYRDICCGSLRCTNGNVSGIYPPGECGIEMSYKIPQNYNRFRSYGSDEVPGFYYDLSAPHIGGQAVYGQGNKDYVPNMLLVNQTNLPDRCFNCTQPIWDRKCI